MSPHNSVTLAMIVLFVTSFIARGWYAGVRNFVLERTGRSKEGAV